MTQGIIMMKMMMMAKMIKVYMHVEACSHSVFIDIHIMSF